jgi:hypothetical protein
MTDHYLPASVRSSFYLAGWRPGRLVETEAPRGHPAHAVLSAFSGLRVGKDGAGRTCAAGSIAFGPLDAGQRDETIDDWERLLRVTLVGIGDLSDGHGELWIASDHRCFGRSLIHDAFYFEGADFGGAVENILLGHRARPLIHPSQQEVTLYGEIYTRNHPETYDFTAGLD